MGKKQNNEIPLEGLEGVGFTATQLKILELLMDGKLHTREEIHSCLPDDLGAKTNIHSHITTVRNKIRDAGYLIVIQFRNRVPMYLLSKSIEPPIGD